MAVYQMPRYRAAMTCAELIRHKACDLHKHGGHNQQLFELELMEFKRDSWAAIREVISDDLGEQRWFDELLTYRE